MVVNAGPAAVIDAASDKTRYVHSLDSDFGGIYVAENDEPVVISRGPTLTLLDPMSDTVVGQIIYPPAAAASCPAPRTLKTIGRESTDGRSMTIYDAATLPHRAQDNRVPAGMWSLDMTMFDDGTVVAPSTTGVAGTRAPPWDHDGR